MRRALACALLAIDLTACTARAEPAEPHPVVISGRPVALDTQDPARARVGELTYAGGLVLAGDGAKFGGFSGLVVRPDGRFMSQSDGGWLLQGKIVTDPSGRLTGVEAASLSALLDETGSPFAHKYLADAEDITFIDDPARPQAFAVSFEGNINRGRSRVSIYDSPQARERVVYRAEWADTALHIGANYSFEAITRCPGQDPGGEGRFLLGTEDGQIVFLDPSTGRIENRTLISQPPETFKLTGLDCTADGRIFALYRAFGLLSSWRAMVATLTWERSSKGPVLHRRELARLEGPLTRDNMEGIAAISRPEGGVRLYLISDDNFDNPNTALIGGQRTLLLAFDWAPTPAAPEQGRAKPP